MNLPTEKLASESEDDTSVSVIAVKVKRPPSARSRQCRKARDLNEIDGGRAVHRSASPGLAAPTPCTHYHSLEVMRARIPSEDDHYQQEGACSNIMRLKHEHE